MDDLHKKMRGILLTAEHIGYMEANSRTKNDEYKILDIRDELVEMVERFMSEVEREVLGPDLDPNTSSGAAND